MAEEPGEPSDGMTQPSREKPQWGKKLSQKCKAAWRRCKEWMGGLPLFAAIAIWAVLGIIAVLVVMAVAASSAACSAHASVDIAAAISLG